MEKKFSLIVGVICIIFGILIDEHNYIELADFILGGLHLGYWAGYNLK
jgi:hypothetical protein